jgi:hypothetical protein
MGERGTDLCSLVAGSAINVVPGHRAHKPLEQAIEGLVQKTAYYCNKSRKGQYQQEWRLVTLL